ERFAQAFFECSLQFFVYRGAHSFDLLRIVFLQFLQTQIDDSAHTFQRGGQFFALPFGCVGIFLATARHLFSQHSFAALLGTFEQPDFSEQVVAGRSAPGQQKNYRDQNAAADQAEDEITERIHFSVMSSAVETSFALSGILVRDSSTSLGMTRGSAGRASSE